MSIHISANPGDIADSILLPGDPLRAQFIAETFLENPVCFNKVRGMLGFTGTWKGQRVSVMGTGMGMPSLSIYANELIKSYGVKKLVRVGTCGGITERVKVRDLVLALSASTNSAVNRVRFKGMDYAPAPSFRLLSAAYAEARAKGMTIHVDKIVSSDSFYSFDPEEWKLWAQFGVVGIEMETAELYTLAAQHGVEALAVLTVSDHLILGGDTSSEERERTFTSMIEVGLAAALA